MTIYNSVELRQVLVDEQFESRSSARSLLITMFGEFVLPNGGAVWTSTIVDGLARVGVTEKNARQAIARLSDQGIIRVERVGRLARWHLTDHGRDLLQRGAERIYGFGSGTTEWDRSWFVVICSVPETQRAKRHRFRTQMTFEGFGFIAPGVAVSPHLDREDAANDILRSLDLDLGAVTFTAKSGSLTVDDDVLADAWNLARLAEEYKDFLDELDGASWAGDSNPFTATVQMIDRWRRFPSIDPELPAELLPPDWIGAHAHTMFTQHRNRWAQRASDWYTQAESSTAS